jgi:hypothetical protein
MQQVVLRCNRLRCDATGLCSVAVAAARQRVRVGADGPNGKEA